MDADDHSYHNVYINLDAYSYINFNSHTNPNTHCDGGHVHAYGGIPIADRCFTDANRSDADVYARGYDRRIAYPNANI